MKVVLIIVLSVALLQLVNGERDSVESGIRPPSSRPRPPCRHRPCSGHRVPRHAPKPGSLPWLSLVKVGGRSCSGSILSSRWIMARSECIRPSSNSSDISVEAGESQTKQIIKATVYYGPGLPPSGITFLYLTRDLVSNSNVKAVLLPPYRLRKMNWHYKDAMVSGYRSTDKSTELHTFFAITNNTCRDSSPLCALGYDWPLHDETSTKIARATDFLTYYDPDCHKTFLIGVLKNHFTTNTASYYKVSDMMDWINKNLGIHSYEH